MHRPGFCDKYGPVSVIRASVLLPAALNGLYPALCGASLTRTTLSVLIGAGIGFASYHCGVYGHKIGDRLADRWKQGVINGARTTRSLQAAFYFAALSVSLPLNQIAQSALISHMAQQKESFTLRMQPRPQPGAPQ